MSKTITILKLDFYNGQRSEYTNMYFETEEGAIEWLKKNGYEPNTIYGWKKDYLETAKIENVELHETKTKIENMGKEETYTDKEMLQRTKVNQLPDHWTILDIIEAYDEHVIGYLQTIKESKS